MWAILSRKSQVSSMLCFISKHVKEHSKNTGALSAGNQTQNAPIFRIFYIRVLVEVKLIQSDIPLLFRRTALHGGDAPIPSNRHNSELQCRQITYNINTASSLTPSCMMDYVQALIQLHMQRTGGEVGR